MAFRLSFKNSASGARSGKLTKRPQQYHPFVFSLH